MSEVANSDPYDALAPDRLHIFHSGLFSDHLWKQAKRHIEALGKKTINKQVDDQYVMFI
jgi:hypothetical protein